jgi:RNA polymerase sigma factor (TIGR02999 family)
VDDSSIEVTALLERFRAGDLDARNHLVAVLYNQFRHRARARLHFERPSISLGPTDLADEALLRLLKYDELTKARNRNELHRAFARAMRQVLIDHARNCDAPIHGGGWARVDLDDVAEDLRLQTGGTAEAVHEALTALAKQAQEEDDERARRTAIAMEMKFFGGFTHQEIADTLGMSLSTIEKDLRWGFAWLKAFLAPEPTDGAP